MTVYVSKEGSSRLTEFRLDSLVLLSSCTALTAMQPTVTRAPVQISVLKQKWPQQMWHCKTTWPRFKPTWVWQSEAVLCVSEKMSESSTLLLTAEITSPAGLRTVLHHGGSWNSDVTFEPQPGPDQVVDLLIKYLSAPGNCKTGSWWSAEKLLFFQVSINLVTCGRRLALLNCRRNWSV